MKIDAHQHYWKYNERDYGWMPDKMSAIRRDFLPENLAKEQAKIGFDGAVAVQARQRIEETRWLLELAELNENVRGVVGWVDLCSENLEYEIERFSERPKLVGVRHVVHDEPDEEFMLRPAFLRGLAKLSAHNLAYDLLLFPKHLPVAEKVVRQFPDLKFVLDHISKPFIKDGAHSPWDQDLKTLAGYRNVTVKLSGMVTEADWKDWGKDDFRPYLDTVLEAFGPERCMIGSDWPVCLVAGEYEAVMNIVIDYVSRLSPSEQALVLGETCAKTYGLTG